MKIIYLFKKVIPLCIVLFIFSCKPREELAYYQNIDALKSAAQVNTFEITMQPDDLLVIIVTADDAESAVPFNITSGGGGSAGGSTVPSVVQQSIQTYLIDAQGFIDFPVLGKLKVGGLLRSEMQKMLQTKIATFINNPIINIRRLNFKVSVQGEVNAAGTYSINSDRMTLIEAISMARDLTIYGRRDNILIIRESNGVKSYNRVDITKADFINSPFYYLAQNDVVYVEPSKVKINGAAVGPSTAIIFSVTSLTITVAAFLISIFK